MAGGEPVELGGIQEHVEALDGHGSADLRELSLRLAHVIRNPLATIKSSVQLVKLLGLCQLEAVPYLDNAIAEVARIDAVVREMERLVRVEVGHPEPFEVADAIGAAGMTVGTAPGGMVVGGPGSLGVRVRMDRTQFLVALKELLDNARRVTGAGAAVGVTWSRTGDGFVHVEVTDEGPGVPPELSDRILRPFFSTDTQGSGLGLNLVQRICRLAGGALIWANLEGGGCRFTLVLPEG